MSFFMVRFSISNLRQLKVEQSSLGGHGFFERGRMLREGNWRCEGEMLREGLRRGCYRPNAFGDGVI